MLRNLLFAGFQAPLQRFDLTLIQGFGLESPVFQIHREISVPGLVGVGGRARIGMGRR